MANDVFVSVDLSSLIKFGEQVDAQMHGSSGPIDAMITQWGVRYRSFAQERYDKYSKGGGDWAPLKESTIKRRRHGRNKSGLSAAILRDTNTMFTVLSPVFRNQPGALQQRLSDGILVGFGGPHRHPSGGTATIADIATFHNEGAGNLPQREIIVAPPSYVIDGMAQDGNRALQKLAEQIP